MMILILSLVFQLPPIVEFRSIEYLDSIAPRIDRSNVGEVFTQVSYKSWTFIGPQPIGDEYWSGHSPASGRVSSIAVDPTNANIVYIAAAQGGVWKTTDGGNTWVPLTDGLPSLSSGCIAIDPSDPNTLYYGTGEMHYCGDCYYGDGLFKSTDGGATWVKIAGTQDVGRFISKIVVDPTNSNKVLVSGNIGIIFSSDGGTSWTRTLIGQVNDIEINPQNTSIIYAGVWRDGVYKSNDGGYTWTKLQGGLPTSGFRRIELAISPSNPNIVYASITDSVGGLYGLFKTEDGGNSWDSLPNTPNYLHHIGWYSHAIIVNPGNPDVVIAGGVFPYRGNPYGLVMTTDGGNHWTDITIAIDGTQVHPDIHTLAIGSDGTLWVGCDGGVWKTNNPGATWVNLNEDLGITQFYSAAVHPFYSDSIIGGTQDNGSALYSGNLEWQSIRAGDGGPCMFDWDDPDIYYTTYIAMRGLRKHFSQGGSVDITGPWKDLGDRASWATGPLVMDPQDHNTIYVGTYRVWRTTDGGATWDSISGDLSGGTHAVLFSIAVSPSNTNIIYTGSSRGKVYKSVDHGSTWNEIDRGTFGTNGIVDIVVDPSNSDNVYLVVAHTSGGRVYKSHDGGANWLDITGDLVDGLKPLSLAVDFSTPLPQLYLGTDHGVYFSANSGHNWSEPLDGLPHVAVYEIQIDTANDYVVVATHGRGMWRTPLISTKVRESADIPTNPGILMANGILKITGLSPLRKYNVGIYDVTGRAIKMLLVRNKNEIQINADLPNGFYFIHLSSEDYEKVLKIGVYR